MTVQYGTKKRRKAEKINYFIEGIFKNEGFYWYPVNQDKLDKTLTKNEQLFYQEATFKRHEFSGSSDSNNKAIDFLILSFKVIAEKLIQAFPQYQEEYETFILPYLEKEERNSDLVASNFFSQIGEHTIIRKIDIEESDWNATVSNKRKAVLSNKEVPGYWYEHELLYMSQKYLKPPFSYYGDGVYFVSSQNPNEFHPEVSFVISIEDGVAETSIQNEKMFRYLLDETNRERLIQNKIDSMYDCFSEHLWNVTEEQYKNDKKVKEQAFAAIEKKYPIYEEQEEFILFKKELTSYESYIPFADEQEEDDFFEYSCSNCKDGGCIHCEPHNYL